PQDPSATTRRVLLVARDHVARTHDAAGGVAALADPDAAQGRMLEAPVVVRVREMRPQLRRRVLRPEAEAVCDPAGVDDLAGIHLPVGIPDRLELAEGLDQFGAEHL